MIRPLGDNILVRIIPGEHATDLWRPEEAVAVAAGEVIALGPKVKGLRVGELIVFHRAHLVASKQAKQLGKALRDEGAEGEFLLKWFDALFSVDNLDGVVIQGVRWPSSKSSLPSREGAA